jgi:hypothetical protein
MAHVETLDYILPDRSTAGRQFHRRPRVTDFTMVVDAHGGRVV